MGRIDKVHWDADPVWLSLIDVDTGDFMLLSSSTSFGG